MSMTTKETDTGRIDLSARLGTDDLTGRFRDRHNPNNVSAFAEGTVTRLPDAFHVSGASKCGYNIETFVDRVYVGYGNELNIDVGETLDVGGLEYRLGDELHLRVPREDN